MPYEWLPPEGDTRRLHLSVHRSLPPAGFVWFIGGTAALIAVPLLPVIATPVFWGLLPFVLGALGAIWWALKRSWSDRAVTEDLVLSRDLITLTRRGPRGRVQSWQANPFWASVHLHPQGGPVPDYLTLKGDGREVEIGAFLTEGERRALHDEIAAALAEMR